ncbi:MAG: M48 family metalloprotease [Pseudomonadota bacterium]
MSVLKKVWMAVTSAALGLLLSLQPAWSQSFLSDAETEHFLRETMRPIFVVAGLEPRSVRFFIINDPSLNAFVAAGQNIFIHTGLILQTDNVGQVIGVLAHETGHITGGHNVRRQEGVQKPTAIAIASMLLGVAAIAAGAGDAGIGIISGGQQAATRSYLSFSRAQESSTDQAGARFLEKAGLSGRGMVETFRKFATSEYLIGVPQDPYVRTHPLSSDRVARLEAVVSRSPYYDKPDDPHAVAAYERIKGKIEGFLFAPDATLRKYPASNGSVRARYARAYAYHKAVEIDKSMAEIDSLLGETPDDPYYLELKGQLLLENGLVREALAPLRRAVEVFPDEPQIRTLLGRTLLATEDPALRKEAIYELERAVDMDEESPFTWYQLGIAYNLEGDQGSASLAAAFQAAMSGQLAPTLINARRAVEMLPKGTPKWQRAQDLLVDAQNYMEDNDIKPEEMDKRRH